MIKAIPQPLFRVSNHHTADCGAPPCIDGDAANTYYGYFENAFREQFIFVYERDSKRATVWMGDGSWDREYTFRDGCLYGHDGAPTIVSEIEQLEHRQRLLVPASSWWLIRDGNSWWPSSSGF